MSYADKQTIPAPKSNETDAGAADRALDDAPYLALIELFSEPPKSRWDHSYRLWEYDPVYQKFVRDPIALAIEQCFTEVFGINKEDEDALVHTSQIF